MTTVLLRDAGDMLEGASGATLTVMDPPWAEYNQRPGKAAPDRHYPVLTLAQIVGHIDAAWVASAPRARLALWGCWPLLPEILAALKVTRWKYKTGGSWHKEAKAPGVGHHWRGHSEFVFIATKGSPGRARKLDDGTLLRNAHGSPRQRHSAKPVEWQREWVEAWTDPGDLVLDPYAGRGSVGVAAQLAGRRYLGAEADPGRYALAASRLGIG